VQLQQRANDWIRSESLPDHAIVGTGDGEDPFKTRAVKVEDQMDELPRARLRVIVQARLEPPRQFLDSLIEGRRVFR
jgi:hypothetical protein